MYFDHEVVGTLTCNAFHVSLLLVPQRKPATEVLWSEWDGTGILCEES